MSNEGFFRRWSRRKLRGEDAGAPAPASQVNARDGYLRAGEGASMHPTALRANESPAAFEPLPQTTQHPPVAPAPAPAAPERKPATLDDVAVLGADSDFSAFVSQGVDKAVQRLAMKKLFSDPHFNIMDGLDVYIDDFTKSDPVPAAMLASMQHARSMFSRLLGDDNKQQDEPGGEPKPPPNPDTPPQGDA
jgi:hypothetical protein